MKVAAALALMVVAAALVYAFSPHSKETTLVDHKDTSVVSIVLTENGFEPNNVRIQKGTEVIFSSTLGKQFWPASNLHPSHGIYPAFDPLRPIEPEGTWSFVFDQAGTWGLHDHLRSYYTGTIEVVEPR